MKVANVVSVQDRGILGESAGAGSSAARVDAMTRLLRLYPEIADAERQALLEFLTKGPPEEIVQVTQLQGLEPRFHQFRQDHSRDFPVGLRAWLPLILFALIAIVGIVWRMML